MRKKLIVLFILTLMGSNVVVAEDLRQAQYTVDIVDISEPPDQKIPVQQIWRKGEKVRIEWELDVGKQDVGKEGKVKMIVIIKDGFEYLYSPDDNTKTCTKMRITPNMPMPIPSFFDLVNPFDYQISHIKTDAKLVKTEVLRGYPCDVYERTSEYAVHRYWFWKDKNFPVRIETETGGKIESWVDYKDIKLDVEIDDKLFDLPEGLTFRDESFQPE